MKKPFSQRRRNDAQAAGLRIIGGFLIAMVIVLLLVATRLLLPNLFAALTTPLWEVGNSLTTDVGSYTAGFGDKTKLASENAALSEQVQILTDENAVLATRSQDLTKLLGGASNTNTDLLAGVLARPPESPYDMLTIAAGTSDGIATGAFVYSAGGTPIGTIQNVTADTSTVSLFSTAERNTSGWIGQSRIPVTLTGAGAGAFSATIPQTSSVEVGDTVYVPGPGALPIGTVVRIDSDPSSPTVVLHIQSLVNLFSITWVEVARS